MKINKKKLLEKNLFEVYYEIKINKIPINSIYIRTLNNIRYKNENFHL